MHTCRTSLVICDVYKCGWKVIVFSFIWNYLFWKPRVGYIPIVELIFVTGCFKQTSNVMDIRELLLVYNYILAIAY